MLSSSYRNLNSPVIANHSKILPIHKDDAINSILDTGRGFYSFELPIQLSTKI